MMEPKQQRFSIWYVTAAVIGLLLIQSLIFAPHPENLSYSEFKGLLKHGKVSNLVLGKETITGALSPVGLEGLLPKDKIEELKRYGGGVHRFVTARVEDPGLVPELEAAKVNFTGTVENTWLKALISWVLPAVIFFGLWALLIRRMNPQRGLMAIGKSKAREAPGHALFPAPYPTGEREYSEETARIIDGEIRQLLEAAHARVRQTLAAKRAVLDALAKLLIEQEVVDRAALTRFLSTAAPA